MERLIIGVKRINLQERGSEVGWSVEIFPNYTTMAVEFNLEAPVSFLDEITPAHLDVIADADEVAKKLIEQALGGDNLIYVAGNLVSGYSPKTGIRAPF